MTNNFSAGSRDHDAECGAFNGASQNAITLFRPPEGRLRKESFFTEISGLVSRRDITSYRCHRPEDDASGTRRGQDRSQDRPVAQTLDACAKSRRTRKRCRSFWPAIRQSRHAGLSQHHHQSPRGRDRGTTANTFDYSGTGTLTHGVLASGLSKFGDNAKSVVCWVMHSKGLLRPCEAKYFG